MDLFDRGRRSPEGGGDGKGPEETVEGSVERIVFAGHDGSFTVARLALAAGGELLTIVGALPGIPNGARLRVRGHYVQNARFGRQLEVTAFTELSPETLEGVRRYLGSGLIKGIGKEFAKRIVDKFGLRTLEVLDKEPYRIGEVAGIGRGRANAIRAAWVEQKGVRDVMVFLQGHGVSPAFAARIYKRYGAASVARVRENPYRLASEVWGIGFLSADRLAGTLGIEKDSDVRVDAGVRHELSEAGGQGHVFLPRQLLEERCAERLAVDVGLVRAAVDRLGREGEVAIERADVRRPGSEAAAGPEEIVYDSGLYRAERAVADGIAGLLAARSRGPVVAQLDVAVARYEEKAGLELAPEQREAIRRALSDRVLVVTGGPGVGKTTIVRGIVSVADRARLRVLLAAPTGRAAKRLSEATGNPAATLHRLLEWRPAESAFGRNAERTLEADLVVVDEASMIDIRLGADLLAAVAPGTRLVLVGDVDQLPSVGPGTVLRDLIASHAVPTVRLQQIFRQAARSLIVTNAHRINAGELPEMQGAPAAGGKDERDYFFLEEGDPARAAEVVRDLVVKRLPQRFGLQPHEIQVLAPMHRGELGAAHLNALLQEQLTAGQLDVTRGQRIFRLGDRVMQIRNNYDKDVFNGDIGAVTAIKDGNLEVSFDDRVIGYEADDLDELVLAYAITIHKSQGSEYPAVVVPIHTQHYVMLERNLLYTAVTRGKRLVVLVGSKKALAMAVKKGEAAARFCRLGQRLAEGQRGAGARAQAGARVFPDSA